MAKSSLAMRVCTVWLNSLVKFNSYNNKIHEFEYFFLFFFGHC